MAKTKSYNASDIEVLSGVEGIRKNIGMYLGRAETQVLHSFREIYENAVDVFIKEMNDFVGIGLITTGSRKDKKQTFIVVDKGPGIPVEKNKATKVSTLTTVFTSLHSGSNFDKQKKGKAASRGKHGVGSVACNAAAEQFIVYTCRDKQWYTQTFNYGKPVTEVTKCKLPTKYKQYGASPTCGTVVEFVPDYKVLPNTIISDKELFDFIKQNAELNTGLKVKFVSDSINEVICNKKGIVSLLEDYISNQKKVQILGKPFIFENDILNVALQWSNLEGEHILSYVNSAKTPEGGTHVQGMFDCITKEFKAVAGRGVDFTASDLREGLIAVVHYKCTDDDYSGQNKEKLNSPSAINVVKETLSKPLSKWIKANAKLVREISLRATKIKEAKAEARALTRAASNLKTTNKSVLVPNGKLVMSDRSCLPEKRELFIVEGDSAAGCWTTDTNVMTLDGVKTFSELINEHNEGLINYGFAFDIEKNEQVTVQLQFPHITKYVDELVEIEFEDGTSYTCTPEHLILLENGTYVEAQFLTNASKIKSTENSKPNKVRSVQPISFPHKVPVCDLQVDKYHNFALGNGIIVHNSVIHERDSSYQEVLKLRGKALNVAKTTSVAKDLQNAEISNVLIAIGADANKIKKGQKVDTFRLGKIILLTDEDIDGEHIKVLLFTILDKYAPEAFKQGIVYIAKLPLFQASNPKTGEKVFGNTLKEVQEKGGINWQISRLKGLGEMDANELAPFALYPETRKLVRISYFKSDKEREEYLKMVGNDVQYRKKMLGVN